MTCNKIPEDLATLMKSGKTGPSCGTVVCGQKSFKFSRTNSPSIQARYSFWNLIIKDVMQKWKFKMYEVRSA